MMRLTLVADPWGSHLGRRSDSLGLWAFSYVGLYKILYDETK